MHHQAKRHLFKNRAGQREKAKEIERAWHLATTSQYRRLRKRQPLGQGPLFGHLNKTTGYLRQNIPLANAESLITNNLSFDIKWISNNSNAIIFGIEKNPSFKICSCQDSLNA